MKLYTEEQVKKVWKAGQKYWETSGASITLEELLEQLTSISLPSDEEIEKETREHSINYSSGRTHPEIRHISYANGFLEGIKWYREQLKKK